MIAKIEYAPFMKRKGREAQRAGYARTFHFTSLLISNGDPNPSPLMPKGELKGV